MTATQAPTPGPLSGKRYRKKPVVIEAIQWTGDNLRSVITFTDGPPDTRSHHASMKWEDYEDLVARDGLRIFTREDGPDAQVKHYASVGDFIIRGVQGELYACKPDIFAATYEPESLAPTAPVEASGSEPSWKTALLELKDKLWIARCDSRDEGFRAAAERAIKMADDADWTPFNPARAEAPDEGVVKAWDSDVLDTFGGYSQNILTRTPYVAKTGERVRSQQPLYAHPSPTPAADADRVRIAIENSDAEWLKDLLLDAMDQSPSECEEHGHNDHDARIIRILAALKSTAAKEGGES